MATLHQATLTPSKLEVLAAYLPTREGLGVAPDDELTLLGAYRFDDPAGEVGIESHLIASGDGRTLHMPLTYRAAPLDGAEEWFITTLEHSALGTRFVYNGCGDTVYLAELIRTIVTGDEQAKLEVLTPDGTIERDNTVHVKGSGHADTGGAPITSVMATPSGDETAVSVGERRLAIRHVLEPGASAAELHLAGTWPGITEPVVLATLTD